MELPAPKLTIDKLALTIDVPLSAQGRWLEESLTSRGVAGLSASLASTWDCEEVYHPSPILGYSRAMVVRRGEEVCRFDFSPYRTVKRKISPETILAGRAYDAYIAWKNQLDVWQVVHADDENKWDSCPVLKEVQPDMYLDYDIDWKTGEFIPKSAADPISFLRMEFNPSKFPDSSAFLHDLIQKHCLDSTNLRMKSFFHQFHETMKPTRIDVAIDYPLKIADLGVYGLRKRITNSWYNGGEPETLYLGKSGGNQTAIYDKVRERCKAYMSTEKRTQEEIQKYLAEHKDKPVTRVEARVRNLYKEGGMKVNTTESLRKLVNPFETLEILNVKTLDASADWKDKAVACMIQVYGVQATLKSMPKMTAVRYRRRFKEEGAPIVHPKDVFEAQFRECGKDLLPCLFK